MDKENVEDLMQQAELHIRNARGELYELGRSIDAIRKAF